MKILRHFLALAALILIPWSEAAATVVIYKGSAKILRGDAVVATTNTRTAFFIMDFNTLESTFVFAQKINGVKSIYNDGSRSYGVAEVATKPKSTISYTSADGSFSATTNFTFRGVRMRGTKSSFLIQATATTPALIPKTLAGSVSFTFGNPIVFDGTVSVTFDKTRTFDANRLGFSVTNAANDIITTYVEELGFVNLVP